MTNPRTPAGDAGGREAVGRAARQAHATVGASTSVPEQLRRRGAWLGETALDDKLRRAWRDQKIAAWRAQPPLCFDPRQWTELKEPDPDALVLRQVVSIAVEAPRREVHGGAVGRS